MQRNNIRSILFTGDTFEEAMLRENVDTRKLDIGWFG